MEILLPFLSDGASPGEVILAPRPRTRDGVLCLVDNNKDSVGREFLEELGSEIVQLGFASDFFLHTKRGATWTVTESEVHTVLAKAHMVITGVGT